MGIRQVRRHRAWDLFYLAVSAYVAVALVQSGAIERWIGAADAYVWLESVIAGFFFTSLFTIAPASVALAELTQHASVGTVALFGALGAVVGDFILLAFMRNRLVHDIHTYKLGAWGATLRRWRSHPFLHWLLPLVGAILIASPLPDEVGLMLMGLSRTNGTVVAIVSFAMNFLGILLLAAGVEAFR